MLRALILLGMLLLMLLLLLLLLLLVVLLVLVMMMVVVVVIEGVLLVLRQWLSSGVMMEIVTLRLVVAGYHVLALMSWVLLLLRLLKWINGFV